MWTPFELIETFSDVLPSGLTQAWSLVTVANFGLEPTDAFFKIYADGQTPYCSVGINEAGIFINREGAQEGVSADLYPNLFDGKFHKIQIFFDKNDVSLLVDCIQVARLPLAPVTG